MACSFLPFPSRKTAGGDDLLDLLRRGGNERGLPLFEHVRDTLLELGVPIEVDLCEHREGDTWFAVLSPRLGRDLGRDDRICAGLCVSWSETGRFESFATERLFRVACSNGTLVECEQGQTVRGKALSARSRRSSVDAVIARSFAGPGLDLDVARLEHTLQQMLPSPYEALLHMLSEGVIDEPERDRIQRAFSEANDPTVYGLINAVTAVARRLRTTDDWRRSFHLERLGGEILRGDHQPPVSQAVHSR